MFTRSLLVAAPVASLLLSLPAIADDSKPAATPPTAPAATPPATPPAAPPAETKPAPAPGSWEARMQTINDWLAEQRKGGKPLDRAALEALARETLAGAEVSSLDLGQIQSSWMAIAAAPEVRAATIARLETLAAAKDDSGAGAAYFLARSTGDGDPAIQSARARAAFDHPAFTQFLASSGMRTRMQAASLLSAIAVADRAAYSDRVLGWAKEFRPDLPVADLRLAGGYLTTLRDMKETIGAERFEAARLQVLANVGAAAEKARGEGRADDAAALDKLGKRLDSAAMKGTLVGSPAPALAFNWVQDVNGTPSWTSVADLKGKVVVLDFWATWCGPCVASFPNVRELREHYSPEDVVIVGVTSLQGNHYWRKNDAKPDRPAKIETKGNPSLEHELMAEYMKEMGITWAVAFTEGDVFNPDYDVSGIPHLALIDANGVLRFNDLHPAMPMRSKTDKIDELLKEAGKTPPAAPPDPEPAPAR